MSNRAKVNIILTCLLAFVVVAFGIQHGNAKAQYREFAIQNTYTILMPLIELYSEAGQNYPKAIKAHHELLGRYIANIETNQPPLLARVLAFSPKTTNMRELKRLQKKLSDWLSKNNSKINDTDKKIEDARKTIEDARKIVLQILADLEPLLTEQIAIQRRNDMPPKLQEELFNACSKSHKAVKTYSTGFDKEIATEERLKKVQDAEDTCHENRYTIALAVLGAIAHQNFIVDQTMLQQFREDIDRTIYFNKILQKTFPENTDPKSSYGRLELYSHSELRRRHILTAIIDNDPYKAQKLLLASVRKALAEE